MILVLNTYYTCSGTSNNGHSEKGPTSLQRTLFLAPNDYLSTVLIQFEPSRRGQPRALYKGQICLSQGVLYLEVPL